MSIHSAATTLFVPAARPERFEKAANSGAETIILDLEDAVAPADKPAARANLRVGFTSVPTVIRINAIGSVWHEDDLAAAVALHPDAVMVPKSEFTGEFQLLAERLAAQSIAILALVETAQGFAQIREIARVRGVARLAFGSWDYCADIGAEHINDALLLPRSEIVLASRLAGLPAPIDGVTTAIHDAAVIEADAQYARALGFGGKLTIHPNQVEPIHRGFAPSAAELAWAEKVIASGEAAANVDGLMVDEPIRIRARAILARQTKPAL
jgi:citrate lyase subunit beta/citryl-CoA lyase